MCLQTPSIEVVYSESGAELICTMYHAASGARLLTEVEAAEAEVERLRQKLREHGISE